MLEVVSKPASRKTMDCPVIWPVVRAGNSPGNGDEEDVEGQDVGSVCGDWQIYTCLVTLLQFNQTVDEVSRTWDYPAEC